MSKVAEKHASMKALIIYDNFTFAAKANAIMQRAAHKADTNLRWTIRPWKSDVLRLPPAADEALMEATDAHLIVLPTRLAHQFPGWLRNWLERWAELRKIKDPALGVISVERCDNFTSPSVELNDFVLQHGLHLLGETNLIHRIPRMLPFAFAPERTRLHLAHSHSASLALSESYRGFGINE